MKSYKLRFTRNLNSHFARKCNWLYDSWHFICSNPHIIFLSANLSISLGKDAVLITLLARYLTHPSLIFFFFPLFQMQSNCPWMSISFLKGHRTEVLHLYTAQAFWACRPRSSRLGSTGLSCCQLSAGCKICGTRPSLDKWGAGMLIQN